MATTVRYQIVSHAQIPTRSISFGGNISRPMCSFQTLVHQRESGVDISAALSVKLAELYYRNLELN